MMSRDDARKFREECMTHFGWSENTFYNRIKGHCFIGPYEEQEFIRTLRKYYPNFWCFMKSIRDFIVFSSLNEAEDAPKNGCVIVLDTQDQVNEFADHLEKHTLLSVHSVRKMDYFYFTVGTFYGCSVLEVHLKEDVESTDFRITSEQVAIAETYSYFQQLAYKKQ